MWSTSLPGDPSVITPLTILTALVLVIWGLRPGAVFLVVTMLSEAALQSLVSTSLARPRPPVIYSMISQPLTLSFPSGHAWATFLFVSVLGFVLWRTLPKHWSVRVTIISVATAIAMLVGASRVYLGVHWPSDILGAWVLAIFTFVTTSAIYLGVVKRFKLKERNQPIGPLWFRITITLACLAIVFFLIYRDAGLNPLVIR
jgi:undecaprenyl-diphosphatase